MHVFSGIFHPAPNKRTPPTTENALRHTCMLKVNYRMVSHLNADCIHRGIAAITKVLRALFALFLFPPHSLDSFPSDSYFLFVIHNKVGWFMMHMKWNNNNKENDKKCAVVVAVETLCSPTVYFKKERRSKMKHWIVCVGQTCTLTVSR